MSSGEDNSKIIAFWVQKLWCGLLFFLIKESAWLVAGDTVLECMFHSQHHQKQKKIKNIKRKSGSTVIFCQKRHYCPCDQHVEPKISNRVGENVSKNSKWAGLSGFTGDESPFSPSCGEIHFSPCHAQIRTLSMGASNSQVPQFKQF